MEGTKEDQTVIRGGGKMQRHKSLLTLFSAAILFPLAVSGCSPSGTNEEKTVIESITIMKNEPEGFRKLKWGDPVSLLKDINTETTSGEIENRFLGDLYDDYLSVKKGARVVTFIDPIVDDINGYRVANDEEYLLDLKIENDSNRLHWKWNVNTIYYFYKDNFMAAIVTIDFHDRDKILNMLSDIYGPPTTKFITSERNHLEDKKRFDEKYHINYKIFIEGHSEAPIVKGKGIPTYIWDGKYCFVLHQYDYILWVSTTQYNKFREDVITYVNAEKNKE